MITQIATRIFSEIIESVYFFVSFIKTHFDAIRKNKEDSENAVSKDQRAACTCACAAADFRRSRMCPVAARAAGVHGSRDGRTCRTPELTPEPTPEPTPDPPVLISFNFDEPKGFTQDGKDPMRLNAPKPKKDKSFITVRQEQGGTLLLISAAILIINLLVDILYAFIDPRVRFGKK